MGTLRGVKREVSKVEFKVELVKLRSLSLTNSHLRPILLSITTVHLSMCYPRFVKERIISLKLIAKNF
jgi:hypothetical protein